MPDNPYAQDLPNIIRLLQAGGRAIFPNSTSLASGQPDTSPYPSMTPSPGGKLRSTEDPRHAGALNEGAGVASAALGGMALGRAAAGAALGGAGGAAVGEALYPGAEAALGEAGQTHGILRDLAIGNLPNLASDPAYGAQKLSRDERAQVEIDRQKQKSAADAQVEAEKAKGQNQLQLEAARREAEDKAAKVKEHEQSIMPWRERHKDWASSLPVAGDVAAIGIPMAASLLSRGRLGKMARDWQGATQRGQEFVGANPSKELPPSLRTELQAHMDEWNKARDPIGKAGMATGAIMPLEASMFPMEMDAMTLPQDAPDKWAILHQDPQELAMRVGTSAMQGLPFSKAGSMLGKAGLPAVPRAQTRGLLAHIPTDEPPSGPPSGGPMPMSQSATPYEPPPNWGMGPIDPNSPQAISQMLKGGRLPSGRYTKLHNKPAND